MKTIITSFRTDKSTREEIKNKAKKLKLSISSLMLLFWSKFKHKL